MAKLQPKHFKALQLFEDGLLSLKEIAAACQIELTNFYKMVEGDTATVGDIATLFKAELDKITIRSGEKIKVLVKDNKKIALEMMNARLRSLKNKPKLNEKEVTELNRHINALSKVTPRVEIGTFSYHQGLTAEDLASEFTRLSAIARAALDGRGVSGSGQEASGRIPELDNLPKK
jgi:hypothetical protein